MSDKESLIQKAKLLEQAERWQDMALCMKQVVEMGGDPLTTEERNLLSVGYKNMVDSRRLALLNIASAERKATDDSETLQAAKWSREKAHVVTELKGICGEVLVLLDKFLIKRVDTSVVDVADAVSLESEVFYRKMAGDYFRYLAEISEGEEKEDMVMGARESYKKAHEKAANLKTTHPIRIGLALILNYSLFHYDVRNDPQEASRLFCYLQL
ncbi:14-3-3 protein zeta-like [Branchiostoma floridae]|uniref:14-3-3 protein zeta-like n=1 Tax=Branchiostoma floridae TaxID=7739 RepID=A0A9J7LLY2_BRAFL|nr:14-3-3 protein zeta-like [Branchiostoma floridae]XP_035684176.1 14-3-3 protein zeta-like [Branchiostoma floridae]